MAQQRQYRGILGDLQILVFSRTDFHADLALAGAELYMHSLQMTQKKTTVATRSQQSTGYISWTSVRQLLRATTSKA